mgnify:FL=1
MHRALTLVAPKLDPKRPHYLMGVGTPRDLLTAIAAGVDVFDCVMPTRNARNGQAFVDGGKVIVKQAKYRLDTRPIDETCQCPACRGGFSRAYLRHLYLAGEILVHRLLTAHNLWFYQGLIAEARRAILEQRFAEYAVEKLRERAPDESAG